MIHEVDWESSWLFHWLHTAKRSQNVSVSAKQAAFTKWHMGSSHQEEDIFSAAWPVYSIDTCYLCSINTPHKILNVPQDGLEKMWLHLHHLMLKGWEFRLGPQNPLLLLCPWFWFFKNLSKNVFILHKTLVLFLVQKRIALSHWLHADGAASCWGSPPPSGEHVQ
jgi:hypothetical protein